MNDAQRARRASGMVVALAAALGCAQPAAAQEADKFLTLQNISSATVAPSGTVFASLTGTSQRSRTFDDADGSIEVGFGLGSAEQAVGVQFGATITSLSGSFADSGYLSVKLSRRIAAGAHPTYVSIEGDRIGTWGDANLADPRGAIAVTTFGIADFSAGGGRTPYMLTFGIGNDLRNDQRDAGVFAGAGIGVTESLALSAAWTGETFDVGASLRPVAARNLSVNISVNDVFDSEDNRRVTVSVGWSLANVFGG